jgi:hypothetical protein
MKFISPQFELNLDGFHVFDKVFVFKTENDTFEKDFEGQVTEVVKFGGKLRYLNVKNILTGDMCSVYLSQVKKI